ncbi:hypothetical protein KMW28_21350 [Flammeovirga yaeyamensis]|uniref:Uncharacterized protein n=1 Tax=Flammeovirga yaeyamensis TaxID=367791 RepID=A0AAX1NDE4_9BACT|nr:MULTISPECIES: hypothetical protein [Flammeovirga]ANQ52710.2 hypothetical protein MY04_5378 [Flammeovirga sp. MY04]MBB3697101.1 ABC-type Zn uptake system ZnuABC Zn-binding protein ZnuA [Flammeovirga yaeyamensis]NMF33763.1 hypothetical protein [Flammeovirga yaeyamensis]QWG04971.1 hypothetical protein KMW28_21350 [Flammeovirga yaeyamensis]
MSTILVIVLFMFVMLVGLFSVATQSKHNLNALGVVSAIVFVSFVLAKIAVQL